MALKNRWCRLVANTRIRPNRPRKVARLAEGWASRGLAVWENDRVVCSETISPATAIAPMNIRRIEPISSPITTSLITAEATPLIAVGTGGIIAPSTGNSIRARAKAKASLMRGGTATSPSPGISITRALIRAKIRPAA